MTRRCLFPLYANELDSASFPEAFEPPQHAIFLDYDEDDPTDENVDPFDDLDEADDDWDEEDNEIEDEDDDDLEFDSDDLDDDEY